MSSLRQWLEQHALGKHAKLLAENEVDLDVLPELQEADLEKIGLALGPRKKLLKAIRELELSPATDTGKATPQGASAGEAERRQLTVMFADLVGSTELSRTLDPEDLREINRAYQDTATAAIERYGGYVARYMGDGVLAYFGYPQAHEDDAERALRAGSGTHQMRFRRCRPALHWRPALALQPAPLWWATSSVREPRRKAR